MMVRGRGLSGASLGSTGAGQPGHRTLCGTAVPGLGASRQLCAAGLAPSGIPERHQPGRLVLSYVVRGRVLAELARGIDDGTFKDEVEH